MLAVARRAEHQLPIVAAVVLRILDPDGIEALLDGAGRFVGGKHTLPILDDPTGNGIQVTVRHRFLHTHTYVPATAPCAPVANPVQPSWFISTATPGSSLPSIHSRNAPPAVDT